MRADLKGQAAHAVELAQKAGAEDAWATASQSRNVEFEYRDGALEKVKDTTSQSLAIQVYADDRYSSHQTTDLNPDRLGGFVSEAQQRLEAELDLPTGYFTTWGGQFEQQQRAMARLRMMVPVSLATGAPSLRTRLPLDSMCSCWR